MFNWTSGQTFKIDDLLLEKRSPSFFLPWVKTFLPPKAERREIVTRNSQTCQVCMANPGAIAFLGSYDPLRPCRSEEHTSELQSRENLVCRLLLEKKKVKNTR